MWRKLIVSALIGGFAISAVAATESDRESEIIDQAKKVAPANLPPTILKRTAPDGSTKVIYVHENLVKDGQIDTDRFHEIVVEAETKGQINGNKFIATQKRAVKKLGKDAVKLTEADGDGTTVDSWWAGGWGWGWGWGGGMWLGGWGYAGMGAWGWGGCSWGVFSSCGWGCRWW